MRIFRARERYAKKVCAPNRVPLLSFDVIYLRASLLLCVIIDCGKECARMHSVRTSFFFLAFGLATTVNYQNTVAQVNKIGSSSLHRTITTNKTELCGDFVCMCACPTFQIFFFSIGCISQTKFSQCRRQFPNRIGTIAIRSPNNWICEEM